MHTSKPPTLLRRRGVREAPFIQATILVLAILAIAAVPLVAPTASAADACAGTPGSDCPYVVCIGAHRDETTGRVAYCDTTVFWPPASLV